MEPLSPKVTEALTLSTAPSDPRDKLIWQLLQFADEIRKSGEIYDISPDLAIVQDRAHGSKGPWPHLYLYLTPRECEVPLSVEVEFSEEEARLSHTRGQLWFVVSVTRRAERHDLLFPADELAEALASLQELIKVAIFQDRVLEITRQ